MITILLMFALIVSLLWYAFIRFTSFRVCRWSHPSWSGRVLLIEGKSPNQYLSGDIYTKVMAGKLSPPQLEHTFYMDKDVYAIMQGFENPHEGWTDSMTKTIHSEKLGD
jgi:hypothetical protein